MRALIGALLLLAVLLRSAPLFLAVATLFGIASLVRLWLDTALAGLRVKRLAPERLFFGEATSITIRIANTSPLPIPWLLVRESRPSALVLPSQFARVLRVRAGGCETLSYELAGRSRGFHPLGPLLLQAGDPFGLLTREVGLSERQYLIVYPRLLDIGEMEMPSLAIFGDLRSRRRLIGDPARVQGVRNYLPGDPLHDIHWRASAAAGSLQVKQYGQTTTVQCMLFLDLQRATYGSEVMTTGERAISVAATIASRLIEARQEVGLATNGRLAPLDGDDDAPGQAGVEPALSVTAIPASRGAAHVTRLLETLARIDFAAGESLAALLARQAMGLAPGSTVVAISGRASDELLLGLHRVHRQGPPVALVLVARPPDVPALEARTRALGVRLQIIPAERERYAAAPPGLAG